MQYSATFISSLYILSIVVEIITGLILKHPFMHDEFIHCIMKLPLYQRPRIKKF
ncbi:hypothetical protein [secondary endosymbiont of Heteropsylla cubana]|uniref:hypothetical protein n=1 Tax=secondary endosymbiont of Heteropsylla cubana TaxID=134287 RepID=UPI0009FEF7F9